MAGTPRTGDCSGYIPPTQGCEHKPDDPLCEWTQRLACPSSGNAVEAWACTTTDGDLILGRQEIEPPTCCYECNPCEPAAPPTTYPRCPDRQYVIIIENGVEMCCPISPIIVDIAGNGFILTDAAGGVLFDMNGDGLEEHMAWTRTGVDDAWLVLDRDGSGTIDRGAELFGNYTPLGSAFANNGFDALAEYDKPANGGNDDGVVDNRDSIFEALRLWQDANHNAQSEANELKTLPELGVYMFDLAYRESRQTDPNGNAFRYRAKVYDAAGNHVGRWACDVFLVGQ
jgi:hypothetical protein